MFFSTDGRYIIARANSNLSSVGILIVIDVDSGNVISARSYQNSRIHFDNYAIKSILMSSTVNPPVAYVLSEFRTSSSCDAQ